MPSMKSFTSPATLSYSVKKKILFFGALVILCVVIGIIIFMKNQVTYPIAEPGATREEVKEYLRSSSITPVMETETSITAETIVGNVPAELYYDFTNSKYCQAVFRTTKAHLTIFEARLFLNGMLKETTWGIGRVDPEVVRIDMKDTLYFQGI